MAEVEELSGLFAAACKGDQGAFQKLQEELAPFVHALIIARAPPSLAPRLIRSVMVQAAVKLDSGDVRKFLQVVFEAARKAGDTNSNVPDSTDDPSTDDGRATLKALKPVAMPQRERLLMRLVEGLTGPEIADLLGVPEADVRTGFDQALAQHLKVAVGTFANDGYLWSLVGNPPGPIVSLENRLTQLRFDLALLASQDEDARTEAGLLTEAGPKTDLRTVVPGARPSGGAATNVNPVNPPRPSGGKLTGATVSQLPPVMDEPSDRTDPTASALAEEKTSNVVVSKLPHTGALPQSSGTVVKTIPASDLPAAAAMALEAGSYAQLPPVVGGQPLPPEITKEQDITRDVPRNSNGTASVIKPLKADLPWNSESANEAPGHGTSTSGSKKRANFDDESTEVKVPPPLPAFSGPVSGSDDVSGEPTRAPISKEQQGWRASKLLGAPEPKAVADTRAVLKPVPDRPRRGEAGEPPPTVASLMGTRRPFVIAGLFLAIAIGIGALTLSGVERGVKQGWNLVPVLVAATDLPDGTVVTIEDVSQRAVPEQFVTSSVVRPDKTDLVLNQKLLVPVQAGDPILWNQFEFSHLFERLSHKVMKRARAYSVRVTNVTAVGGWMQPTDHVDVLVSMVDQDKRNSVTVTLMQNLTVVAVGKVTETTLKRHEESYQDVSLLLLEEEAELLSLAQTVGKLQFTLRSDDPADPDILEERYQTKISTLIEGSRVKVLQQKRFNTINVIRSSATPHNNKL